MKWYVDRIFREIWSTKKDLEDKLEEIDNEELRAVRIARQGAPISEHKWRSFKDRRGAIENHEKVLEFLKSRLHFHHRPKNSVKPKDFYHQIIQTEVMDKLIREENYEGCIIVEEFMQPFYERQQ